ncbi:MAG: hypothetical protein MZV64_59435 [Ignavibacteriales bacterium]|nr:hypothetical protein [Ignavibacteriales bacterium]
MLSVKPSRDDDRRRGLVVVHLAGGPLPGRPATVGSTSSARSPELKTSTSALPSWPSSRLTITTGISDKPAADAAAKAPGDETHADGQQEGRQQHEDQRRPVAEARLRSLRPMRRVFHESPMSCDELVRCSDLHTDATLNRASAPPWSDAGRPLPGSARGCRSSGS